MLNFVQPIGGFQYFTDDFTSFLFNKAVIIFEQNTLFGLDDAANRDDGETDLQ